MLPFIQGLLFAMQNRSFMMTTPIILNTSTPSAAALMNPLQHLLMDKTEVLASFVNAINGL